jgi:hypothetical protein
MGFESGIWTCEVCGRPVSRLLGMAGLVGLHEGGVQLRAVVRAYCLQDREEVRRGFVEELEALGHALWSAEPDVELRPRTALAWMQHVEQELGAGLPGGRGFVRSRDGRCPHCAAHVAWGRGPHLQDASSRPDGVACECSSRGATGIAYVAT